MKFKEIDRTATVAWSPATVDNIYLAAGTAAQQLDSSFSTNAVLEIYQLNVNEPGLDVPIKSTYTSENRFHKVVWGCHGIGGEKDEHPKGIIVGGCDGGVMQVFDANKLFQGEDPIVLTKTKHTGPVRALDFNCFRSNLIASGATESEIFIWDLNNPKVPMSPGAKIQPSDDVTDLEWNKQVEHILATTFPARCVVWDLRKNEPVIKVSDSTSRIRYKCVRWHPEVATQMCLASEDDNSPVIQLWDLRYATSPLKVIQGHQRGILGMSWCAQDPELLLSCGKDSRILCWNPNYPHAGYEMVLDIPTSSQWSFDVSFCPKNPIILSSCTFDGRVSIYGLSGGAQQPVTSSKLADSFPGMDMSLSNAPVPAVATTAQQLRDPPKWFKRPAGVRFAFGGRLVSFQNIKTPSTQPGVPDRTTGTVTISQVVTLPSFIERSKKLEEALQTGSLEYYCAEKARVAADSKEVRVWEFLQASFSQNPRQAYVSLLGFNTSEMISKLQEIVQTGDIDALANNLDSLSGFSNSVGLGEGGGMQNGIGIKPLAGGNPEFSVPTDESVDGRINQALLCGNIEVAVYLCLENERWADALLLATRGTPELMTKAQAKYFQKSRGRSTNMIRAIVRNDLDHLVSNCELESWKQALATSLTYADEAEFRKVSETLGRRLLESKNDNLAHGALLCFICSGSLNQLVDAWVGTSTKGSSPDELQDLVEQVMILKKAAEMWGRDSNIGGGSLAGKMIEYASILASQGCLDTALNYLKDSNDPSINTLKDRLQLSLGYTRPTRSQIAARSRQSSESSGYRGLHKRPSHPSAAPAVNRSSDMYQPTDFSNLTGPVHPPSIPAYNSTTTGYGAHSQYSPAAPQTTGPPMYTPSGNMNTAGLPPKPPGPTTAPVGPPPSFYNPNSSAEMVPPKPYDPSHGAPSNDSFPRPPTSNVASGWNDPPPILAKSKVTPPTSQQTPGLLMYAQPGNAGVAGLPSGAPSQGPPPTLYNPAEAAAEMAPPKSHEPLQRKISTDSLSRGSISNVASGWNDPPPALIKPKTIQSTSSQQMITHPIFGTATAPEAANTFVPGGLPPAPGGLPPPVTPSLPYGAPPPTAAGIPSMNPSMGYGVPPPSGMQTMNPPSSYGVSVPPPPTASGVPPPSMSYGVSGPPPPMGAGMPQGNQSMSYGAPMPPPPTAASQPYNYYPKLQTSPQ